MRINKLEEILNIESGSLPFSIISKSSLSVDNEYLFHNDEYKLDCGKLVYLSKPYKSEVYFFDTIDNYKFDIRKVYKLVKRVYELDYGLTFIARHENKLLHYINRIFLYYAKRYEFVIYPPQPHKSNTSDYSYFTIRGIGGAPILDLFDMCYTTGQSKKSIMKYDGTKYEAPWNEIDDIMEPIIAEQNRLKPPVEIYEYFPTPY